MFFAFLLSFFLQPVFGVTPCESFLDSILSHLNQPHPFLQVESSLQGLPWSNPSAPSWTLRHPDIVQFSIPESTLRVNDVLHLAQDPKNDLLVLTDLGPSIWSIPDYMDWRELGKKQLNRPEMAQRELIKVLQDSNYCPKVVAHEICNWVRELSPFRANAIRPYGAEEIMTVMAREALISRLIGRDDYGKTVLLKDQFDLRTRTNLAALPLLMTALPFLKEFPVGRLLPKIFDETWNSVPVLVKRFHFRGLKGRFVLSLNRQFHPITFGVRLRIHIDPSEEGLHILTNEPTRLALFEAVRRWVTEAMNDWTTARNEPMPVVSMGWEDVSAPKTLLIELDHLSYDLHAGGMPVMSNQERLLFSLFLTKRPFAHRHLHWQQ